MYNTEYRKLTNQARFIQEIIDNDLIVGKKRKDVLVQELRDRQYEAFPRGTDPKEKNTEDEINESGGENDDDGTAADKGGARDYDYLLSVRYAASAHCSFL